MPELRHDQASGGVDFVDDVLPAGQRIVAIEPGRGRIVGCAPVRHPSAFRYDQADATFRPPTIIGGDIRTGHAVGR
ncbi:hypothetical protein D3C87_2148340 [compost metagenome]